MAAHSLGRPLGWTARALLTLLGSLLLVALLGCGVPEGMGQPTPAVSAGASAPASTSSSERAEPTRPVEASAGDASLVPVTLSSFELVSWRQAGQTPAVVDVRAKWICEQDRIPGALCIPLADLEARLSELPRDKEIVVYASGYGDADAADVRAGTQLLKKQGFQKVYALQDGLAGYAVATAPSCGCKP